MYTFLSKQLKLVELFKKKFPNSSTLGYLKVMHLLGHRKQKTCSMLLSHIYEVQMCNFLSNLH